MKKKYIVTIAVVIFLGIFLYSSLTKVQPEEIENAPNWVEIEKASAQAEQSGKLILVDVYEVGCKYCRGMERNVYPDSTVRAVIDRNYIPVRLDGNSQDTVEFNNTSIVAKEFAQSKGAFVFPTTLVLDKEGNVIKKRTGYMNVDELRQFLYTKNL